MLPPTVCLGTRHRFGHKSSCSSCSGQPIPRVKYTAAEIQTWYAIPGMTIELLPTVSQLLKNVISVYRGTVFNKLTELYPTHACKQFNDILPRLIKECGYRCVANKLSA